MVDFDLTGALPFDRDANDNAPAVLAVPGPFLYIGQALTAHEFGPYVQGYNFGRIPPDSIVLHHTAIPSTLAARYPTGAVWDAGEAGLSDGAILSKRRKQLDALANYYQHTLGWDRGPHLFIDDRYIWLFTPMNAVGIHAKEGNSYGSGANLHYSIGIEVVGYYEHVAWPPPVAANVRAAVQALCSRLDIAPIYKPAPVHTPQAHARSISSHRDYNKPQCPGAAITEAYYITTVSPPQPPAEPKRYRVRGLPIYQRTDLVGTVAGWLDSGAVVAIDRTYANGAGHLADGRGFVDMDGLD
jgi:hypothetical protein